MKKMKKCVVAGLSLLAMMAGLTACGQGAKSTEEAKATEKTMVEESAELSNVKIGVLTYNATDSEMVMFRSYLKEYLGDAFGVEYYYADSIASLEDEKNFIDQAREAGCQGVIAFVSNGLEEIVDYCGEDMFYAVQNMTPTAEEFDAVKDKPQFLGVVSPSNDAEYESGADIAKSMMGEAADSSKVWLIFTGGASYGNNMHSQRTKGMVDTLTAAGYQLSCEADETLTAQTPMVIAQGQDGGQVYICPGYPSVFTENVEQALSMCEADIITSVCTLESNREQIEAYEKKINKDVKVGLVDCFSESVAEVVNNGEIDYLTGKYGAMVAPSFVAMLNAVNGDEDLVKKDGQAYWINLDVWSAGDKEAFMKLYSESANVYDNIYDTDEIMSVLGAYNENARYEDFMNFVN